MIGEVVFSKKSYMHRLAGVVIGSIVYRIVIAFVLRISLNSKFIIKITADDMKLITAILVTVAMILPRMQKKSLAKSVKEDQK